MMSYYNFVESAVKPEQTFSNHQLDMGFLLSYREIRWEAVYGSIWPCPPVFRENHDLFFIIVTFSDKSESVRESFFYQFDNFLRNT